MAADIGTILTDNAMQNAMQLISFACLRSVYVCSFEVVGRRRDVIFF